jgi:hypothetical protein
MCKQVFESLLPGDVVCRYLWVKIPAVFLDGQTFSHMPQPVRLASAARKVIDLCTHRQFLFVAGIFGVTHSTGGQCSLFGLRPYDWFGWMKVFSG